MAEILTTRFRVALTGQMRRSDGAELPCIRATDLPPPNGFVVQVTSGWRSVDAKFLPDSFAGHLIRTMGDAGPDSRLLFGRAAQAFSDSGIRLTLAINQSGVQELSALPPQPWSRFELAAHRMTAAATVGQDAVLNEASEVAAACLALILSLLPVEEGSAETTPLFETGLPEGAISRVTVNRYERNPVNRAACIAKHGTVCAACGFDFGKAYGPIGAGYIEVHHLVPVSKMGGIYVVDPIRDLIPLCANCHAIAHRHDPPLQLRELRELLAR